MKNLEKSWNFKTAISRPGKVLENLGNLFDKSLYNTIMFIQVLNFGTGLRMGYIAYFFPAAFDFKMMDIHTFIQ